MEDHMKDFFQNGEINQIDKTTANIGFCASWADGITMSICISVQLLFGQDVHR